MLDVCFSFFFFFYYYTETLAEVSILGAGVGPFDDDDAALIFYVTVKNICKDDLELAVGMKQCCETIGQDETECNSMTLIGGDMGVLPANYAKNLTLIYSNIYLFNRRGVCNIEVAYRNQFKKKEITIDLHFDTTKSCPEGDEEGGGAKKKRCETVDLDPRQNCNPVDCLIKYSGTLSYFNPECKRCQKVPPCDSKKDAPSPDVAYSPYTNECVNVDRPITKQDLEALETKSPDANQVTMINAICHYGKVTDGGECLCNDGWVSFTNDEDVYEPGVAQHHLCNVQVGDWNCVNRDRMKITAVLIAVFALTIVSKVLLLMCIMTWCYKHFRKSDKSCARELDPDDRSILLCEDGVSFDKCLCCDEDEDHEPDHGRVLTSQTVNVSYYPGSPSVFSSIRTSTGSTGYTGKTEQSISLSQTSTSAAISFAEGGDSFTASDEEDDDDDEEEVDDSENSNEKLFCGDAIGNRVAYGVYCGVNDAEGDEVEVEEEEEDEEREVVDNKREPSDKSGQESIKTVNISDA